MAKVRVGDLAAQMGISDKDLIFKLQSLGVEVENSSSAIDPEVVMGILTGRRKVATRPRNVIMREDAPTVEKKKKVVRPPRPIVAPPKREPKPVPTDLGVTPANQGPIIPEFVKAAEQEAAEAAQRAALEAKEAEERAKVARAKPKAEAKPAEEKTEEKAPESKEKPKAAEPARPAAKKPDERRPEPRAARPRSEEPRIGATGPKARLLTRERPSYKAQPQLRDNVRAARVARSGDDRGRGSSAPEPLAPRATGGRIATSAPPPVTPPRRRRGGEGDDERVEKKKTTGRRGRRTSAPVEDTSLFTKGPISATAVLEEETDTSVAAEHQRRTTSRRDARRQTAATRQLEFERPEGTITLSEGVTVKELADKLNIKANDLMKHLMLKKGMMLNINAPLEQEVATDIARELGIEVDFVSFEDAMELEALENISEGEGGETVDRAPVITVMGHVDHGKTSLLDAIRETDVAGGEAGGITQHIGAYQVEKNGRKIVFLDTPGHEAFTMMRARGAKVTDIVILVVAADDGVMPQTKEAIDHARAAKVPMIVAVNKIDKPNANPERVYRELSEIGVLVEPWGGDVVSVAISALKKQGIEDLLDMILLTADMLELKSTPALPARGVVLEARKEAGRGITATVLVQDGSLAVGDDFISGTVTGRVRFMNDDKGARVKEVGPATPVSISGFDDVPNAGDTFLAVDEESKGRAIIEMRQEKARQAAMQKSPSKMSLDQLFGQMEEGKIKQLDVVVKGDVQGSVEVVADTLRKLSNEQVRINVLHASVGAISTNDVLLASASEAIVVGFNVRPERNATELAEKEGVDIRLHTIIYQLIDEVKAAMTGLLDPTMKEVFLGRAEVRETFRVPKMGTIAGCMVTEGTITRTASVRLLRDNVVVHEGKVGSLRHFKNDVSEVRQGFECGIGLEKYQDIKIGDVIEAYKTEKVAGILQ